MIRESFFKKVVGNFILGAVIITVLVFTIAPQTVNASLTRDTAIYKGSSPDEVSLMVNVYWGTEYLEPMLEIFENNNVVTTFFVGGMWANENDSMLKKIQSKGHEIGNHGYYHKDHKNLSAKRNYDEIDITHKLVKSITGIEMNLFAPPSGSFGKVTLTEAEKLGYYTIMWTRDTVDWRDHDSELIYKRATAKTEGGDLILMHPTKETAAALDRIIKFLKEKNLTVAPVSKVIKLAQIN